MATYLQGSGQAVFCRMEVAPATGSTTTMLAPYDVLLYTNPGTIAAQTVVLPASPADGALVAICSTAAITTLTLSPAVTGAPSGLAAGGALALMYSATLATPGWFVFP